MKEAKDVFKGVVAKNWKQENTLKAVYEKFLNREDYDETKDVTPDVSKELTQRLSEVMDIVNEYKTSTYYYLKEMLPLGDIHGYKNVLLQSISFSYGNSFYDRPPHLVYHLKFDVENPFTEKIEKLKLIDKSFEKITKEEWKSVEKDWEKNYHELRDLDCFIPDIDYAYIYELPQEKLSEILALVRTDEYKQFAKNMVDKTTLQREMVHRIPKFTYAERLDYWDLYDEINDIHSGKKPTEKTLLERKKRREKTEEQYNKESAEMKALMDEFLQEKENKS